MSKTKFERIKEQQKKARNKEILYRVEQILKYDKAETIDILFEIVTILHTLEPSVLYPQDIMQYFPYGYKIIDTTNDNEVTKDE